MISSPLRSACFYALLCIAASLSPEVNAQQPASVKSSALKDLDGHFPFTVPTTLEQWNARAERLRLQVRVALGVHPMPEIAKQKPIIHGRIERDGYTVEKMYFESLP